MNRPLIIAHRGFSGRYPENTLVAVRGAIRAGADMVEVDVQETSDGEIVAFHDERLRRLCGVPGRVGATTLARLHALNPLVPTLAEVLRMCRGRVGVLVEIKRADPLKVAAVIKQCRMEDETIVFSFSVKQIRALTGSGLRLFGLVEFGLRFGVPVAGMGLSRRLMRSRRVVDRLHGRGLEVFVWAVDDPAEMARLAEWGVDGIITNYPDVCGVVMGRRPVGIDPTGMANVI